MNDPARLYWERIEEQIGAVASSVTRWQLVRFRPSPCWRPSINAYRCPDCFVICMDLSGVDRRAISVRAEARRLIVSGDRPPPEPNLKEPHPLQVLAMEIDYGPFERMLDLPAEVDPERVAAEHRDGLLWIHLPLKLHER
jgi:HSP20 family protein